MKNLTHLFFILISLISLSTFAQTSNKTLNYQAVILDPNAIDIPGASISGQPLNKGKVCLRFSLLNAQGGLDYEETQQVTTDEFGLVSVAIGAGSQALASNSTSIYKSFESIVWNANVKSLKVSVSYDGCNSFKQVSTQIFNYTPYALYAEAVDYKNVRDAPTKLSQFSNDAGFLIPKDLDPLKTDIKINSSQIATANQTIAENKQASDAAFLVVNQSLTSLDKQVADNTSSISSMSTKLADQQNQIIDNRNQLGGLQGQLNITNSNVSNLSGVAEMQSNKSAATNLGGANPSDQMYPTQKAAKAYVDQIVSQIATSGVPDATTLAAGKVQLAGDLGGTATNPTVPALAGKENTANKSLNLSADGSNNNKYPSVKAVKDYVDQATLGTALAADLAAKANLASPTFTGTPLAPTPTLADNSTQIATTAFVHSKVNAATVNDASSSAKGILKLAGDLGGSADSPSVEKLRGTPISATPPATAGHVLTYDVNGTATWAAPSNSANTISGVVPVVNGGTGATSAADARMILGVAPISSPEFTGIPKGPTPIISDNSTQLATTEFVQSKVNAATVNDASSTAKGIIQLSGDLSGTAASPNVAKIQGKEVSATTPSSGQILTYNGTLWEPANNLFGYTTSDNIALGISTGIRTNGIRNTSIGNSAMNSNPPGSDNTAIGALAMAHVSQATSDLNVVIGSQAARYFGTGWDANWKSMKESVFIGAMSRASAWDQRNEIVIGYNAVGNGSNTIQMGNTSITNMKTPGTITAGVVTYPSAHGSANQVLTTTGSGTLVWSSPLNSPSASSLTGSVAVVNGGTGATNATDALVNLGAENLFNKSTNISTDANSVTKYPSVKLIKDYVDAQIVSAGVSDGSISSAKITDATITSADISSTAGITNGQLANSEVSIGSTQIALGSSTSTLAGLTSVTSTGFTGALTGNASTATVAGNVTATANTSLTSLVNLGTVGTIISGTWNGNRLDVAHGGTGAVTLTGYLKGNGTNAITASNTIPASDISGLVTKINGVSPDGNGNVSVSIGSVVTGDLASRPVNAGTNGNIYVVSNDANNADNGRTFISDGTNWNEVTTNQSASDARYLQLTGGTMNGNLVIPTTKKISIIDAPLSSTDATNKGYVDGAITNAAIADATTTVAGKLILAGDLAGSGTSANTPRVSSVGGSSAESIHTAEILANASTSSNTVNQIVSRDASGNFSAATVTADLTGNVTGNVTGNISGTATNVTGIVTVAHGGSGVSSLTGYLKGNGAAAYSATATIPASDITGLIKKVNGTVPDADGNVAISFGTVSTGTLVNRPVSPGTNGNIYVVSGDATTAENGRTFISDGTSWKEVTSNQAATDARYLRIAGGTLAGDIVIPANHKITLTDTPISPTDAVNKSYVDGIAASASVAYATTTSTGKIQLAGDLAGSGTSASSPKVASVGGSTAALINSAEIAANAATNANTANAIVKRDVSGNFSAHSISANLVGDVTGNASSATLATNISATSNTTLTSLSNLAAVGTITSGTWNGTAISIAKGGTGATTKEGAFDALSPMISSGDILYGGTNGAGARLAKGNDGSVLTLSNGLPAWLVPGSIRAAAGSVYNAAVGFSFAGGDWARNTGMFSDNPDAGPSATLKFRIATSNGTANSYLEINPTKVSVLPATASTSKTTGALTVAGGLGVSGDIYATNLNVSGSITGSGVVAGVNGGTGVANSGKTITLGGNLSTTHALSITTTGSSTISLPVSGTLATVQQLDAKEVLSNKSTAINLGSTTPSDDFYPSQKAVKTYVDTQISAIGPGASTTYTKGLNASLGGYVFYVTPNGKHGLVAATQDQSISVTQNDARSIISDPANHNTAGKEFTDWRLPTLYESSLMQLDRVNLGLADSNYWTSSENSDGNGGFLRAMNSGNWNGIASKSNLSRVRAIRSF